MTKYKNLIFDFDGVLVNSNDVRIEGFFRLFENYPQEHVDALVEFSRVNGGKSRYEKIRYFFNNIVKKSISEDAVMDLAQEYSIIVKQAVVEAAAVSGSVDFLSCNSGRFSFALVSGSDQSELKSICQQRKIDIFSKAY